MAERLVTPGDRIQRTLECWECPTPAISFASTYPRLKPCALQLDANSAERAAAGAQAPADPTRLTLAAALGATDELCVCDLAWVSERAENPGPHITSRVAWAAGLVNSRRDGKMVMYSLTDVGRSLLGPCSTAREVAS